LAGLNIRKKELSVKQQTTDELTHIKCYPFG
jgi:hypothetical protein